MHIRLGNRTHTIHRHRADHGAEGAGGEPEEWWGSRTRPVELDVSLHQHLFWSLQVDVCDARTFSKHTHLGRAELRLYRLASRDYLFFAE